MLHLSHPNGLQRGYRASGGKSSSIWLAARLPRQQLQPCRVTNTNKEIYDQVGISERELLQDVTYEDLVVHNPELGRYQERVQRFYLNELFEDTGPDLEETAYWFHTPPNGWKAHEVKVQIAEPLPVQWPTPQHLDAEAEARTPISTLEEGTEVTGEVTDIWLYHGAQIDFGAEFDGLIPIYDEEWLQDGVREALEPGSKVTAKIHKVRMPGLYRWPVQLELLRPVEIVDLLMPPDEYEPTVDLEWASEEGMEVEDVCNLTGRNYDTPTYYTQPDLGEQAESFQQAMGWDGENLTVPEEHPLMDKVMNEYSKRMEEVVRGEILGSRHIQ